MMRKKIVVNEANANNNDTVDLNADVSAGEDSEMDTAETTNADGAGDTGLEDYVTALQSEMEELRTRLEDAEKRVIYAQADFQNFRRRKEEEVKDLQKFAAGEVLTQLLPIVDNFERAIAAGESTKNLEALLAGLAGTLKQLHAVLQKGGITAIEALGKEFDPRYHEAIGHVESEEYPPNTVAEEVQKGYTLHDRVVRPALVKVTEG
jgi:molecular chaperone GrpE